MPLKVRKLFVLTGKYGENLGSTVTFLNKNADESIIKEFVFCLQEFKQKIPEWMLNKK